MDQLDRDERRGALTVVGLGMKVGAHVTPETLVAMQRADRLLFSASDVVMAAWIRSIRADAESLSDCYSPDRPRKETYEEMTERALACLRSGSSVCLVFYGHPGLFVIPGHAAVQRAREEGFQADMQPGISSIDCLFTDLAVDPATGCQIYEASDFLLRPRPFDPGSTLILLQIAVIGVMNAPARGLAGRYGLVLLLELLGRHYPPEHEVVVYEASSLTICDAVVQRVPLAGVLDAVITTNSTLYVPALARPPVDPSVLDRWERST